MAKVRVETLIAAPPAVVFDVARDLDFHTKSMAHTGERIVGGRPGGLIELGEEVEWEARQFGVRVRMRSRITGMDRPASFTDVQVRGPFASFTHFHGFEPSPGGTWMLDEWDHRSPFGPLGKVVDAVFLRRHMEGLLPGRAQAIKAEAEKRVR